jgi:alpha-galactosidase
MLEVGTASESASGQNLTAYALDLAEAGTNFAIWAMWSAPLIAGNDPRAMDGSDLASQVLLNREIIAIDQDPLGRPAALVLNQEGWQVWRKPLSGGEVAVAVVNLADSARSALFSWAELGASG